MAGVSKAAGVVLRGDSVLVNGELIGSVLGFDESHAPNHMNIVLGAAERKQILAGVPLGDDYPELSDALLVSVTEMNRGDEFARLAAAIAGGQL